jgi:hypothetical protein
MDRDDGLPLLPIHLGEVLSSSASAEDEEDVVEPPPW